MAIILIESASWRSAFYPLTLTRPLAELQCGFLTLADWWQLMAKCPVKVWTGDYLQKNIRDGELSENETLYFIRSGVVPSVFLWQQIQGLEPGQPLADEQGNILAFGAASGIKASTNLHDILPDIYQAFTRTVTENDPGGIPSLVLPSDAFQLLESPASLLKDHGDWMRLQFTLMTEGRSCAAVPSNNWVQGEDHIFIEEGATVQFAYINGLTGPVYIGRDAVVMEGAMIRGPFGLGEKSTVKMGAKIYGATSCGKGCTLGGEIKNTIFHQGTNKGHEGYIGDSVIGAWCNFGAGAGNSNVKNTAGEVMLYDYESASNLPVGKKFGLMMGDYTRVAINSSLNTGTSIGACSNVFGPGLLPKFIPSFSWGTNNKPERYDLDQAIAHIKNWMHFKQGVLSEMEIRILNHIFDHTS